jgi:predicted lactoylglutathione lyase
VRRCSELKFTHDDAAYLIAGENIFVMLFSESFFKAFAEKEAV